MFKRKSKKNQGAGEDTLLTRFSAKSRYAESYRTLRTNLYFSVMGKDLNSVVVTSSLASEGKSNTVANLGITIAKTGKRVLMVDSDLRKPGLTARFDLKNNTGFANIIGDTLGRNLSTGKIADYGLNDIVTLISLQNRTCVADITDDKNCVKLYFLRGELVDIYWKNRPESKKLASSLIRENLLTKEEATLAIGHQKQSVRRLGSVLLTFGFVSEEDLNKILSVHIMEAFRVVSEMKNGDFAIETASEDLIMPFVSEGSAFQKFYREFISIDNGCSYIQNEIDSAIVETSEENLYIFPAGSIPPNPSELIGSNRAEFVISKLKQKFDLVIFDTSPVMPASDALLLGTQVDGVLLVVKTGATNRTIVKDAIDQLKNSKSNILGVLLNKADMRKDGYYKYYKDYYGE